MLMTIREMEFHAGSALAVPCVLCDTLYEMLNRLGEMKRVRLQACYSTRVLISQTMLGRDASNHKMAQTVLTIKLQTTLNNALSLISVM